MNKTLKAVIVQVTGGNVRNHHINLRGAFGLFPDDTLGGGNISTAGKPVQVAFGSASVSTDIDEEKAIFRERGAVRRFFDEEAVTEGDLILIERQTTRSYRVTKASKRAFAYHL